MHTSWLTAVFRRMLMHESIYVVRWAANTILTLDLYLCPMLEQGQGKVKLVTFLVKNHHSFQSKGSDQLLRYPKICFGETNPSSLSVLQWRVLALNTRTEIVRPTGGGTCRHLSSLWGGSNGLLQKLLGGP